MNSLIVFCLNVKLKIDVVEIDSAIAKVATDWFGFAPSDRLTVHVADGLDYVKKLQTEGRFHKQND
jgi:spermidine synthase